MRNQLRMALCAWTFTTLFATLGGCAHSVQPSDTPSPVNTAASDFGQFEQMVQNRYAEPFRSGDRERWLDVFADDAVALHNRRPADVGIDAIRAFADVVFGNLRAAQFDLTVEEVKREHDWVYTRGRYTSHLVVKETGESMRWGPERGKFLLLWARGNDGVWRVILDMGNSVDAP